MEMARPVVIPFGWSVLLYLFLQIFGRLVDFRIPHGRQPGELTAVVFRFMGVLGALLFGKILLCDLGGRGQGVFSGPMEGGSVSSRALAWNGRPSTSSCAGAASVTAVDIDDQAVRATQENAERNGVLERIFTPALDAIGERAFDIVLANILAKPLIALAPTLTAHAAPGAPLVLSGLLTRQIEDVKNAYTRAFEFAEPVVEEDWVCLNGRRHGAG